MSNNNGQKLIEEENGNIEENIRDNKLRDDTFNDTCCEKYSPNDNDSEDDSLSWLFDSESPDSYMMPVNNLKMTEPTTVIRIYQMARVLDHMLTKEGIRYWTSGGTTLGIVRHGGLIPWDDDIDICIKEQDEAKLISIAQAFSDQGYNLQRSQPYSWKLFPSSPHESDPVHNLNYSHRYPFTDIFVMRAKGSKYLLRDKAGRNAWPNEFYREEDIRNPCPKPYGDSTLNCPLHPEEYLDRTYGAGWTEVGETHYFCHRTAGLRQSVEFCLEGNMFLPALPFR